MARQNPTRQKSVSPGSAGPATGPDSTCETSRGESKSARKDTTKAPGGKAQAPSQRGRKNAPPCPEGYVD